MSSLEGQETSSHIDDLVSDISYMIQRSSLGGEDSVCRERPRRNTRRVSTGLSLHDEYLESMHLPKYSQAEMDAFQSSWERGQGAVVDNRVQEAVKGMSTLLADKSSQCEVAEMTIAVLQRDISTLRQQLSAIELDGSKVTNLEGSLMELGREKQVDIITSMNVMFCGVVGDSC